MESCSRRKKQNWIRELLLTNVLYMSCFLRKQGAPGSKKGPERRSNASKVSQCPPVLSADVHCFSEHDEVLDEIQVPYLVTLLHLNFCSRRFPSARGCRLQCLQSVGGPFL